MSLSRHRWKTDITELAFSLGSSNPPFFQSPPPTWRKTLSAHFPTSGGDQGGGEDPPGLRDVLAGPDLPQHELLRGQQQHQAAPRRRGDPQELSARRPRHAEEAGIIRILGLGVVDIWEKQSWALVVMFKFSIMTNAIFFYLFLNESVWR